VTKTGGREEEGRAAERERAGSSAAAAVVAVKKKKPCPSADPIHSPLVPAFSTVTEGSEPKDKKTKKHAISPDLASPLCRTERRTERSVHRRTRKTEDAHAEHNTRSKSLGVQRTKERHNISYLSPNHPHASERPLVRGSERAERVRRLELSPRFEKEKLGREERKDVVVGSQTNLTPVAVASTRSPRTLPVYASGDKAKEVDERRRLRTALTTPPRQLELCVVEEERLERRKRRELRRLAEAERGHDRAVPGEVPGTEPSRRLRRKRSSASVGRKTRVESSTRIRSRDAEARSKTMGRSPLLPMSVREQSQPKMAFPSSKRWEAFHGDNITGLYDINDGKIGLRNLCNTCFMNAGLQCLSHVEPVAAYFLTGKYKQELNVTNPLGCGGKLAIEFSKFLKLMWSGESRSSSSKAVSPKQMHRALEQFAPHLMEGYEQQDVQEFLAYMLDGLSEDLNLVKEKPPPDNMTEDEEEKMYADMEAKHGEEYVAAMHWKKYLLRNKSFLVDICQGQLRSVLTCTECGYSSKTYDPYLYLSLPVSVNMRSLADSLNSFLEEETLDGDDRWRCKRCKKQVVTTKKMDIYKAPSVLILHLKRFSFSYRTGATSKVNTYLEIPLTLNLSEYIVSTHKDSLTYDVIGVCNHSGPHGFGHYTATCKHPIDNFYYHFNDDEVVLRVEDLNDVISSHAYVVFLLRHATNDPLRRQTITLPDVWPHWVSKKDSQIVPIPEDERIPLSGRRVEDKSAGSSTFGGSAREENFDGFKASGEVTKQNSTGSLNSSVQRMAGRDTEPGSQVAKLDSGRSEKASSSADRRKDSKDSSPRVRPEELDEAVGSRSPPRESTPRKKKWLQNLKSSMDFKKDKSDGTIVVEDKKRAKKDKKDKKKDKKDDDSGPLHTAVSSPSLRKGLFSRSSRKSKQAKQATREGEDGGALREESALTLPADGGRKER